MASLSNSLIESLATRRPTQAEIDLLIEVCRNDDQALRALCAVANQVRQDNLGEKMTKEAAFNAVVPCTLDPFCRYCPYWRSSKQRPMRIETVLKNVAYLAEHTDIRQFHLSGGASPGVGDAGLVEIVEAIRAAGYDHMGVVINCGACFTEKELARLKELNVLRIFSVFETLDSGLFAAMKPGDDLKRKKRFARQIAAAGIQVGTGLMAGLGEEEHRPSYYAKSLEYLSTMEGLSCLYVSKFRHAANIDINDHPACPTGEALALVACARLALPHLQIRLGAGWGRDEAELAMLSGAGNMIMGPCFSEKEDVGCWESGQ